MNKKISLYNVISVKREVVLSVVGLIVTGSVSLLFTMGPIYGKPVTLSYRAVVGDYAKYSFSSTFQNSPQSPP